jgi:hypothetical protein
LSEGQRGRCTRFNLGFLLRERDDLDGAESLCRRAAMVGHPDAEHNLARLRRERED